MRTPRYSPSGPPLVISGGSTIVQSYYNPSVPDLALDAPINGLFYTVPDGGEGWYRLQSVFSPVGAFAPGVDGGQVLASLDGAATADTLVLPIWRMNQGGEGGQASITYAPADMYLKDGQTVFLQSSSIGGPFAVAVQLLLIGLAGDL